MLPKKNPRYDVHAYSGLIFHLSLALILLALNAAFGWRIYEEGAPIDLTKRIELYEINSFHPDPSTTKPNLPQPQSDIRDPEIMLDVALDFD